MQNLKAAARQLFCGIPLFFFFLVSAWRPFLSFSFFRWWRTGEDESSHARPFFHLLIPRVNLNEVGQKWEESSRPHKMKPGAAATLPDESDKVRDEFSPLPPPQSSSPLTLLSALRLRRVLISSFLQSSPSPPSYRTKVKLSSWQRNTWAGRLSAITRARMGL